MNRIIIHPDELSADGRVTLTSRRAKHVVDVLKTEQGKSVRIGIINGRRGTGLVESAENGRVCLHCSLDDEPLPSTEIDIILALPRPKVMKRLWAPLASLGVRRIFVTNAEKVERNYFDTHWLRAEHYEQLLIEGLEQSGETHLPEVTIVRRFKPFLEDQLQDLFGDGSRLYAHPLQEPELDVVPQTGPVVIALGPEGGWTEFEIGMLNSQGFRRVSLGSRTLRTDTAAIAVISAVQSHRAYGAARSL